MNGPGWDTRGPGGARPVNRDRLALIVGATLLVVAILAAVTGKVFAFDPPTLPDNSPAADHIERPSPEPSPKPVDPRSLFLDLPDPPKPPAPEVAGDIAAAEAAASRDATPSARPTEERGADARGRGGGVAGQSFEARSPGRAAAPSDIPVGEADAAAPPPARPVEPGSGKAEDLLADPDCRFSDVARMDLEAGIVDEYLISALQAVCRKHSIYVNVFKTGHTFGAGLEEGPTIPVGYGNAGGYPNTHYFGRAADIWEVDGKPVEGNGADPSVVSVGRMLAGLPSKNKPDVVIGPAAWNRALGYGPEQGWVLDGDQVSLHDDHLHIGYWHGDGTPPPQLFLSENHEHETSSSANGAGTNAPTARSPVRRAADAERTPRKPRPKLKETIQPAESPPPDPRPKRDAESEKAREPAPQKTVERRVQRPETESPEAQEPRTRQPEPKRQQPEPEERPPEPEKRQPEPRPEPEPEQTTPAEPEEPSQDGGETTVSETTVHTGAGPEESTSGGETVTEDAVAPD